MKILSQDNVFRTFGGIKVSKVEEPIIDVLLSSGSMVSGTPEHEIMLSSGVYKKLAQLDVGDEVITKTGTASVNYISESSDECFVYDIVDVEDTHNYFANNSLVHQCLYLDEFAFVENQVEFYTSTYPVISAGKTTQVIITSTPHGLDLFYKIWTDAEECRNKFKTIGYDWTVVPGRDEKWKEETLANTSPVQFAQEYEVSFLGSSNTLIAGWKLQQLTFKEPEEKDEVWSIYNKPEPNHNYCMTVDVAEGLGQDYAVISIFDVTEMPYKHVAVFRNNLIQPIALAEVAFKAANKYNEAYILVENNSIGKIVADSLYYDFEYENMFSSVARNGETDVSFSGKTPGIRTTSKTKALGCSQLKSLIENDGLITNDFNAVSELSTFSQKGRTFRADNGKHDDVVMTMVVFAWFTAQPFFEDMFDVNVRKALRESMDVDSNIGFMFFDDGINDDEPVVDMFN